MVPRSLYRPQGAFTVPFLQRQKDTTVNLRCGSTSSDEKQLESSPIQNKQYGNLASMAIGPTAVIGGTAAFCTAALQSSSLSPLSILYMILLAVQYSIQPRVSKKYFDKRINKRSVTIVEETTKLAMATAMLASYRKENILQILEGWTLQSSLIAAGLPAAIYAVQGVLYVFSYQNLDSVTFNGLSQTKTLSAALCCYIILGQKQSAVQISALVLLALSALIFQGTFAKIIQQWSAQSPSISAEEKQMQKSRFTLGIVPCLAASFLSGLAGAFSQKGLQQTGGAGRNAYLYTMEVSGISAICITFSIIFDRIKERIKINGYDKDQKEKNGTQNNFFDYWTLSTMYPIVLKAFGGVLTALVHKNAGSVAKGFALICGLVLSGIIQTMIDKESLSVDQIVGIILVNVSSWLHFSTPKIV